tara:strand:+ start:1209 stop:1490 length:282 start_codon:yes stop_codon:yes gene_type:complete
MKDNKIIAEFMGGYTPYEKFGDNTEYYYRGKYVKLENMEFYTSWDWLMPVVQKCYKIDDEEGFDNLVDAVSTLDIDGTYKAVVEFINQYNKTK